MRVHVDQEKCISCGYCVNHCGEIFDWNGDHKAEEEMGIVPKDYEESATDAIKKCPTHAIIETNELDDGGMADTTRDQNQSEWILD